MAPVLPCPQCGHRLISDDTTQSSLDETVDTSGRPDSDGDVTEFSPPPSREPDISSEVTALSPLPTKPAPGSGPPPSPPRYSPPPPRSLPEELPTQSYTRKPERDPYPSLADTRPAKRSSSVLTVDAQVPPELKQPPEAPPIPDDSEDSDVFTKTVMDQESPLIAEARAQAKGRGPKPYESDVLTKTSSGYDDGVYSSSPRPGDSQPLPPRPGDSQPVPRRPGDSQPVPRMPMHPGDSQLAGPMLPHPGDSQPIGRPPPPRATPPSSSPPPAAPNLQRPVAPGQIYPGAPPSGVDSYPAQALDALADEPSDSDLPQQSSTRARWQEAHPSARKWAEKRQRGKSSPKPVQIMLGLLLLAASAYLALLFLPEHRPMASGEAGSAALWRFDDQQFQLAAVNAGLFAVLGIVVAARGFFARQNGGGGALSMILGVAFALLTLMFAGLVLWASV